MLGARSAQAGVRGRVGGRCRQLGARVRGGAEQEAAGARGARQAGCARGAREARGRQALGARGEWPGRAGWLWAVHSVYSAYFRSVLTLYCS